MAQQTSDILAATCNTAEFVLNRPLPQGAPVGFMNAYIYVTYLSMTNTNLSTVCMFVGHSLYTVPEYQKMVDTSIQIVIDTQIKTIRKGIKMTKKMDLAMENKDYFTSYIGYFQGVMADKYDLRIIMPFSMAAQLPQTIAI